MIVTKVSINSCVKTKGISVKKVNEVPTRIKSIVVSKLSIWNFLSAMMLLFTEMSVRPLTPNVWRLKEVATFETSLVLTDNVNLKK